jgi:prevent-host-death family protein
MRTARKIITCTEFKIRLGKYLRAVREGRTFFITYRGKIVAKITPV